MPADPERKHTRGCRLTRRGQNLAPKSTDYDDAPRGAMRIINSMSTQASFRAKGGRSSEDTGERRKRPKGEDGPSSKGRGASNGGDDKGKNASKEKDKPAVPGIMPHETLGEYNRRVESIMRAGVSQAIKSAGRVKAEQEKEARRAKEERKERAAAIRRGEAAAAGASNGKASGKGEDKEGAARGTKRKHDASDAAIEFKTKEGPRRLNDIAQAPPSLPSLKVAKSDGASKSVWAAKGKARLGLSAGQERIMEEERERVIKQYREMKAAKEEERGKEREREKVEKERARKAGKGKGGAKVGEEAAPVVRQAVYESDGE